MDSHALTLLQVRCKRWTKLAVTCVLVTLLILLLARLWAFQGWLRPVRVVGGSMAESYWGPHYEVTCRDCGMPFRCGLEFPPADDLAVCPNCGYTKNPIDPALTVAGERVLIDRWSAIVPGLQPWQAVALRNTRDGEQLMVKRVVAGGSGQLEIRGGDLYVDGMIQRKTLQDLRHVRILVHDDRYRPSQDPTVPDRWRAETPKSGWVTTADGYAHARRSTAKPGHWNWIGYHQWTCWTAPSPPAVRTAEAPVLDYYGANQNLSRGPLHVVRDVCLECQLRTRGPGSVSLRLMDGTDRFELVLTPSLGGYYLKHGTRVVGQSWRRFARQPWTVEMALCDHQVLAAINGSTVARYTYEPRSGRVDPAGRTIAVGAFQLAVQLIAPKVFRDIYYLGPGGANAWKCPRRLKPGQWLVLGDNVPISLDSRLWSTVDEQDVLGPIVAWPWQ